MLFLSEVLDALPHMSQTELKEIKIRVEFLLQPTQPEGPLVDWLTEGFMFVLNAQGLPYQALAAIAPKSYWERNQRVRETLLSKSASHLSSQEQRALGRVVATALVDYLQYSGPMSLNKMLVNIDNCVLALEASFPGYVAGSMLDWLVRKK